MVRQWQTINAMYIFKASLFVDITVKYVFNVPISASRFRWSNEFGFVTMDIDHLYPEDSGIYTCRAVNDYGESVTSASVKIEGYESLLLQSQHPVSWQKIQDLERPVVNEQVEPVIQRQKPQIIEPLQNLDNVPEGTAIHLQAVFEPSRDDTMRYEWSRNGQPIMASQLVKTNCDLGYATLDIQNAYADHSGLYTLKLKNSEGEAITSNSVKVLGKNAVLGDVQHESSWKRIQEIEAPKPEAPAMPDQQFPPPTFLSHMNDVAVVEGEPSHFECQVNTSN